jgi:hypothetical protein
MHVFKVTKYDPAHFGDRGYFGPEDSKSDHGRLEAAYLAAVEAFAAETGVTELTIREPAVGGFINFGLEPTIEGHGLIGLFPPDLTGYHDGARVPLTTGVALVRAMLRDNGAWCRLEVDGRFFVHIGYDQYMHIGSAEPCDDAVARVRALGLFPVPVHSSPWDPYCEELEVPRPADDEFWTELTSLAAERGTVILEEQYVGNASRWHRMRAADSSAIRAGLTPRARLAVWPELNEDHPLLTAVLPDDDGVVRVRRKI